MDILEIVNTKIRGEKAITFPLKHIMGGIWDSNSHHILDIRGWGFIQYLEGEGKAEALQDAIGDWVVRALNENYEERLTRSNKMQ